jgi:rod shape determining protein RodA
MKRLQIFRYLDGFLLLVVTLLVIGGTVVIGSANGWVFDSENFSLDTLMVRQIMGYGLGLIAIFIIMICDFRFIKDIAIPAYLLVLILLVLVLRFGEGAYDGDEVRRWLTIGSLSVQPSEIAKIALILLLAWYFDKYKENNRHFLYWMIAAVLAVLPLLLVFKEPDLSTSIVFVCVIISLFFTANIGWKYVGIGVLIVVPAVALILYDAVQAEPRILSAYQVDRILAWLHPEDYALTTAYQSLQAKYAIGSGGLRGVGLFHNSGIVPVATTDFIFGIIGEELGFIGAALFILLLATLTFRILWISTQTKDLFSKLICVGMAAMIGFQSSIHMGVNTAILPNTGLPLPFVSYGLSSLTTNMIGIGLVLRIRAEIKQGKGGHSYEYRINR